MAEWFKAQAWKACVLSKVPWVRIPLSPPFFFEYLMNKIIEFIKKTPKAELHLHIEGTLEPDHLFKFGQKKRCTNSFCKC